jgi:monofunctional glycosyltransferase
MDPLADREPKARPAPEQTGRFGPFTLCCVLGLFAFVLTPLAWVGAHRFWPAPGTMLMVERAFAGEAVTARWVGLGAISSDLVAAAIGAEDSGFCRHDGFDLAAIETALKANARAANQKRGRMRGGSTISQQTAKNLFAWGDRSWARKGVETVYTALIEALWPKDRIMETYLNIAEWGDGRFGAQAAARGLFGVDAAALSARQAAALAAVLPSPNRWNAVSPGGYVRSRIGAIVGRARVVKNEGLAGCVLATAARSAPPRSRPKATPSLPPLPPPPAAEAPPAEDMGMEDAADPPVDAAPAPDPTPDLPAALPATPSPPSAFSTESEPAEVR